MSSVCHVRCHHMDMNHGSQWRELKISFYQVVLLSTAQQGQPMVQCSARRVGSCLGWKPFCYAQLTQPCTAHSVGLTEREAKRWQSRFQIKCAILNIYYTQLLLPTAVVVVLLYPFCSDYAVLCSATAPPLLCHILGNSWADGEGDSLLQRPGGGEVLTFNTDTFRETLLWLSFKVKTTFLQPS